MKPFQFSALFGSLTLIFSLTSPPSFAALADSVADFSAAQGGNSWYYGYYQGSFTSDTFQEMTQFIPSEISFTGNGWYVQQGTYWTQLESEGGHPNSQPGNSGRIPTEQWAVRRWESTVTGFVSISGSYQALYNSGANVHILLNGGEILLEAATGDLSAYQIETYIEAGQYLDFAIDAGGNGDSNDHIRFTATINEAVPVPLPASVFLFSSSLLGMLGWYKAKGMS